MHKMITTLWTDQVMIVCFRMGHNQIHSHIYIKKFSLDKSATCISGLVHQMAGHILQDGPEYRMLRQTCWPWETTVEAKLPMCRPNNIEITDQPKKKKDSEVYARDNIANIDKLFQVNKRRRNRLHKTSTWASDLQRGIANFATLARLGTQSRGGHTRER